ncbi:MAG: N-acetylmuramoyl-L-alanine amidase family protein [Myxococcota bacterium]
MRAVARTLAVLLAAGGVPSGLARTPVVVVDPGHGGSQEGAAGADGTLEKNLALELSRKLRDALVKEVTAQVLLTREKDAHVPLSDRVAFANRYQPDLFISVHANSMPTRKQRERSEGIETYFLSASASGEDAQRTAARENDDGPRSTKKKGGDTLAFILSDLQRTEAHVDSSRLAYAVHQKLVLATGAVDRGVQQAPFYVLTGVEAPAILVEVGFISHPGEGKKLTESAYQEALARAIAAGVRSFLAEVAARDDQLARP